MRIAILSNPPDLSGYVAEILKTWGLPFFDLVKPDSIPFLDPIQVPVLICPASPTNPTGVGDLTGYARRGGTVVTFLPESQLSAAAGLERKDDKEPPLRLRVSQYPSPGLEGELLPVVGRARNYEPGDGVQVLAYLSHADRYEGETTGITLSPLGSGRIICFAFDLAMSILLLRQGDPDLTEVIPEPDRCARPSHLAVDIGPNDAGWVPYTDLLALHFIDVVKRHLSVPVPTLSHLPASVPGILLFSGDEDAARVAWNDNELEYLASRGARMNLYIIPDNTYSTPEDVERYQRHHDVGPHPNLRPLDGQPVSKRVAEFERQILMFQDLFQVKARSYRNHCHAWAGYLEPVEVLERLGLRMDANYMCSSYLRHRTRSPYVAFGTAMPMRYCTVDGRVINVVQQHTHLADDEMFSTADYSYRYSPQQFEVLLERTLDDIVNRFHTPYGVNIHPSNWARFSRPQGEIIIRQASEHGIPVWSWDQWSVFWDARLTWHFTGIEWNGNSLKFKAEGDIADERLRVALPVQHGNYSLVGITVNDEVTPWFEVNRYKQDLALFGFASATTASITAVYA